MHSRKTSLSSHGTSSSHSPSNSSSFNGSLHRPALSISLPTLSPTIGGNERSVSSLSQEIIRLQDVLREREAEITELEASLKESQRAALEADIAASTPDEEPLVNGSSLLNGTLTNGQDAALVSGTLSPRTIDQFDHIRKTMGGNGRMSFSEGASSVMSEDDSLERLNELMLCVLTISFSASTHRDFAVLWHRKRVSTARP